MRVFIARHGESRGNLKNIFTGTLDCPLTEKGYIQAKELAKEAKKNKIDKVFSSSLTRAKETAQVVSEILNIPFEIRESIQEISFGVLQGQKKNITGSPLEQSQKIFFANESEGLENIENRILFFISFLKDLKKKNTEKSILFVGHSNFWLLLLAVLNGKTKNDFVQERVIGNKFSNGEIREITDLI